MTIKIVLPKNETSRPATGQGTKIYTDSGEEIQGVVACDIRIRPDEAITATLEVMVSEVENIERLKGEIIIIDPAQGGGCEDSAQANDQPWMLPSKGERVFSNGELERMKSDRKK